jgi:hypothetical protein
MKFSGFFCDDIRHELDGRRSFLGVYSSSTVVPQFPHIFPKICLFVEIELRHGDDFSNAEIVIIDDDREMARLPASDTSPINPGQGRWVGFEVTMSPVVATKPETMRAKVEVNGVTHAVRHLRFLAKENAPSNDEVKLKSAAPARKTAKKPTASRKRET